MLKQIDFAIVFFLPSTKGDNLNWLITALGITFEYFHQDPPKHVSERPLLIMLEEHESKIIMYQDVAQNFYRPIPPLGMFEDKAKGWRPSLSHRDPRIGSALLISSNPRFRELVATPAPKNVIHPRNESEANSERDPSFIMIAEKQPFIVALPVICTFSANLSSNPLTIESPLSPSLITSNQHPIYASTITSILPKQMNSKVLTTKSSLPGNERESQGQCRYYKYKSVQGHTFNVIKKVDKHTNPPIEPLVA